MYEARECGKGERTLPIIKGKKRTSKTNDKKLRIGNATCGETISIMRTCLITEE